MRDVNEEKIEKKGGLRSFFEMPQSAMGGGMHIELSGNTEAVVDGCVGVLEYDENIIRLAGKKMSVRFTGRRLQLKVLTHDSAVLEGFILGVEFIV
jgi:sporulation protein YqfC